MNSSWNVDSGSPSQEDDCAYIGHSMLEHLATFDNVRPDAFKLLGHSNGAGLTNRILIESDDPRITHAITDSSQVRSPAAPAHCVVT